MFDEWREVLGYEGYYQVSNRGEVRRINATRGATPGRILSQTMQGDYLAISLYRDDVKRKRGVHILACEAFHGPRPNGCVPNHKDTNKLNNSADNLEWLTQLENVRHAKANGLVGGRSMPGELNGRAKLTRGQVDQIRTLRGLESQRRIAGRFGVARSLIQRIHQGKAWAEWPVDLRVQEIPNL